MRIAPHQHRRAYTLIEIILVVVIVLILTALSVPVIRTMLDDSRSTGAADMVRGRLAEARAFAMEEGRPWRVAFMPGTGVIQIAPEESQDWQQTGTDVVERLDLVRTHLPTDIVFGTTIEEILGSSGPSSGGGNWETLAVYLPAGDAREDHVAYVGKAGVYPRSISLRGLTGAVTIEDARMVP